MLTGMLPITISGFGTRDAAYIYAIGESINNTKLFAGTFCIQSLFIGSYLFSLSLFLRLKPNLNSDLNDF